LRVKCFPAEDGRENIWADDEGGECVSDVLDIGWLLKVSTAGENPCALEVFVNSSGLVSGIISLPGVDEKGKVFAVDIFAAIEVCECDARDDGCL
jgi:hypothetical protein